MEQVKVTTTSTLMVPTTIKIIPPVTLVFVLVLLIIVVVCISYLIYKRRQSTSLSNLTKPHKESEENSYASSEHSREFSSKQSDSPDPGYDVIKMANLKEVALKSIQIDSSSKFVLSSKESPLKDEKHDSDPLYSTICSSDGNPHKVVSSDNHPPSLGEHHKRVSNNVSHLSADDNCSNNSGNDTKGEIHGAELDDMTNEPHTYSVVHFEERDRQSEQENKATQDKNKAPKTIYSCSDDEAPSIPPYTVEMMYTAVEKRPKISVEIKDHKDDALPIPPYTGEEYHT